MPVKIKKEGDKFRVVEADGSIATNAAGTPVDGGGHSSRERALAQVGAINTSLRRRKKV